MNKRNIISLISALLLTFAGGFTDAYTFIYRGGVFATMQTGNLIKFFINITKGRQIKELGGGRLNKLLRLFKILIQKSFQKYFSNKIKNNQLIIIVVYTSQNKILILILK